MWDKANLVVIGAGDTPWYWDHSGWYWAMGLHGLFWLVLVGLVVAALALLIRSLARSGSATGNSTMALLDARYARGEIDRGAYLEIRRHPSRASHPFGVPTGAMSWVPKSGGRGKCGETHDLLHEQDVVRSFRARIGPCRGGTGREGFDVLTEIDVKQVLSDRLGIDFKRYQIFGVCDPSDTHQALQVEDKIGLMLPCKVLVEEHETNCVEVCAIDPVASMLAVDNEPLRDIARTMRKKLQAVVSRV